MPALIVDFALERVNVTRMVYKKNSFHALIVGIAVSLCLINKTNKNIHYKTVKPELTELKRC